MSDSEDAMEKMFAVIESTEATEKLSALKMLYKIMQYYPEQVLIDAIILYVEKEGDAVMSMVAIQNLCKIAEECAASIGRLARNKR